MGKKARNRISSAKMGWNEVRVATCHCYVYLRGWGGGGDSSMQCPDVCVRWGSENVPILKDAPTKEKSPY